MNADNSRSLRKQWHTAFVTSLISAAVAIALTFALVRYFDSVSWEEQELNTPPEKVAGLGNGPTVTPDSLGERGVGRLVGLVLVVDQDNPKTFDTEQVLVDFRPRRDALLVEPLDDIRYQGKVTRSFSLEGGYANFTTGLAEDEVAEVVIKDDFSISYDPGKIPVARLAALAHQRNKRYYFVEAATLTSVIYQKYRKSRSNSKISGSAFKAGGDIYVSTEKKAQTGKVRLTGWFLPSQSDEEILPRNVRAAIATEQPLTSEQEKRLLGYLREQSSPMMLDSQEITINLP